MINYKLVKLLKASFSNKFIDNPSRPPQALLSYDIATKLH